MNTSLCVPPVRDMHINISTNEAPVPIMGISVESSGATDDSPASWIPPSPELEKKWTRLDILRSMDKATPTTKPSASTIKSLLGAIGSLVLEEQEVVDRLKAWSVAPAVYRKITAQWKRHKLCVWIDTCSPISLVSWDWYLQHASDCQLYPYQQHTVFSGLGAGEALAFKGLVVLQLILGGISISVIAAVWNQHLPAGCDILLGNYDMDFNKLEFTQSPFGSFITKAGTTRFGVTERDEVRLKPIGLIPTPLPEEPYTGMDMWSEEEWVFTNPGVYFVEVTRRDSKQLPEGWCAWGECTQEVISITPYLRAITTGFIVDGVTGKAKLEIYKSGWAVLRVPIGTVWASIVEDDISPVNQQLVDLSQLFVASRTQKIGVLTGEGVPQQAPMNEAEIILHDKDRKERLKLVVRDFVRKWRSMNSTTKDSWVAQVETKSKAAKNADVDTASVAAFPGSTGDVQSPVRVNHMEPSLNAALDDHDEEDIMDRAEAASMYRDSVPELNDFEFLMAVGAHTWSRPSGLSLLETPEFVPAATAVLLARDAGLFRLNYNRVLNPIRGYEYEVQFQPGEDSRPVDSGQRKYSDMETLEICRQVMQLIKSGVLSATRSPWSSGLVIIKKGGGGLRMCVDLRNINRKTLHVASQLPLITEVLHESFKQGDNIFATLDMSQAYHQLIVAPSSRKYLAFKLPRVSAQQCEELGFTPPFQVTWNRVPFGLTDAVTSFSNITMDVFQPAGFEPYLDDMGFGANGVTKLTAKLWRVFRLAARGGISFGTKCSLYQTSITFLGYQVSVDGIKLDPKRIESLLNVGTPRNVKDVKTFLGMVQFCATWLGIDFAETIAPLSDLLKNPTRPQFGWGAVHDEAVTRVKELLTTAPALAPFDNTLESLLVTDGSERGVGAALLQKHPSGWKQCMFLSKKLSEVQQRWNVSQYELYALILCLDRWRKFLIDRPFTVLTDHSALQYLTGKTLFHGRRLVRWQMLLSEFQIYIQHHAGAKNGLADCLSRLFSRCTRSWESKITAQADDEELIALIDSLKFDTAVSKQTIGVIQPRPTSSVIGVQQSQVHQLYNRGDRVVIDTQKWGRPWPGTIMCRHRKNSQHKIFYRVLCDRKGVQAEEVNIVEQYLLTPELQLPVPEEVDNAEQLDTEFLFPDPVPTTEVPVPPVARRSLIVGDLVQVKLSTSSLFLSHSSEIIPLGTVILVNNSGVSVRLFTPGRPTLITSEHLVIKLASREQIMRAQPASTLLYDIGDIVVVKDVAKAAHLLQTLRSRNVLRSDYENTLVGIVKGVKTANTFYVHFGDFDNGCVELNSLDIALIVSGQGPQSRVNNRGEKFMQLSAAQLELLNSLPRTEGAPQVHFSADWMEDMKREIVKDPIMGEIVKFLVDGTLSPMWPPTNKKKAHLLHNVYEWEEGLLWRKTHQTRKVVVPISLRWIVMALSHDLSQHFDWHRTLATAQQRYWFHGMPEVARRYVGECLICQRQRNADCWTKRYGKEIAERMEYALPGTWWTIDLKSMPADEFGNTEFLCAIDLFCRFVIWVPLQSKAVKEVIPAVWQSLILRFGANIQLLADKDSAFTTAHADALLALYKIRAHFISERNSRNQGCVERYMRTFTNHFSKAKQNSSLEDKQWSTWGRQLTAIYNATYHPEVGNSPYYLLFQREYDSTVAEHLITAEYAKKKVNGYTAEQWIVKLRDQHKACVDLVKARFITRRRFAELQHALSDIVPHFEKDDLVLLGLGDSNGGFMVKNRCHAGPFKVLRRPSTTQYIICGGDERPVNVHGFRLYPYTPTLADALGNGSLAASAVGAGQARLLEFVANDPALE